GGERAGRPPGEDAAEEPAEKRERRDARGEGGETDQNGGGDPTADTRGERPEPRVQVHAASLEPIPHLGKRQLRDPRGRRPAPELQSRRPTPPAVGAAAGRRRRGPRLPQHLVVRPARLGLADALLHHHLRDVLVLTHRRPPPWPPLFHPWRPRGSRQMRTAPLRIRSAGGRAKLLI